LDGKRSSGNANWTKLFESAENIAFIKGPSGLKNFNKRCTVASISLFFFNKVEEEDVDAFMPLFVPAVPPGAVPGALLVAE